jgi:DNA gyrase subunit A
VGIPIPDLSDGLTTAARRLLAVIDGKNRERERSPDEGSPYVKTWGPVHAVHLEDPSFALMDLFSMVLRLSRNWICRYPLIESQGNFGTIDGDGPAGMRYTEVGLSPSGESMLPDPQTVPFPNLLCNGAWAHSGTWLADDGEQLFEEESEVHCDCIPHEPIHGGDLLAFFPPHNLAEIGRALLLLLDRPEASLREVMERVSGPDFPTGALLVNPEALPAIYESGEGVVQLRARANAERTSGGGAIIVSEIPYGVTKTTVLEQIAELILVEEKRSAFDVRDMSSRSGMRIEVHLRSGTDPSEVLQKLLLGSALQQTVMLRMRGRANGETRTVGLLELLHAEIRRGRAILGSDEELRNQIRRWIDFSDPRRTTIVGG